MLLLSETFRAEPELQSLAARRREPVAQGCKGSYVARIQNALNIVDDAGLKVNGEYTCATAVAVLGFNQKRAIPNERYRSQANNYVSGASILKLDQEVLMSEDGSRAPSAPRIVDIRPQPPASRQAVRGPRPVSLAPLRKTSLVGGELAPHISPAPDDVNGIEVLVNQFGAFTVVDGVGGEVRLLDETVGKLSYANEPQAHTDPMRISRRSELFFVQGLKVGSTWIVARGKGGQPVVGGFGDMIDFRVLADSDRLRWRPKWSVKIAPRMTCEPWAVSPFGDGAKVAGVLVKAPLIEFEGTVDPDETIDINDYELGIMQAVNSSVLMALYQDTGSRRWTYTISGPAGRARDAADDSTFWYHRSSVKKLSAAGGKSVSSNDSPQMPVPWNTRNKRGALVSTGGRDTYSTWLAARQISVQPGQARKLVVLCWADWAVNWSCQFDAATEKRTVLGGGTITGRGVDGQGTVAPIQGGRTALEQTTAEWSPDEG